MKKRMGQWIKTHRYCWALSYLIFYVAVFFALDFWSEPKYMIYCSLDALIPFCEWFAIFYYAWFLAFPGMLLFYLFFDEGDFKKLCWVMFGGCSFIFLVYFFFPTEINIRPAEIGDNVLCQMIKFIWAIDRPNNVFPSLHVSISSAIFLITASSEKMKSLKWFQKPVLWLMALICLSTVFVKQHSVVDVAGGILVSCVGYLFYYLLSENKTQSSVIEHRTDKKTFDSKRLRLGIIKMKGED